MSVQAGKKQPRLSVRSRAIQLAFEINSEINQGNLSEARLTAKLELLKLLAKLTPPFRYKQRKPKKSKELEQALSQF